MGRLEVAVREQYSKDPTLYSGYCNYFQGVWPTANEPLFDLGTRLTLLGIPEFVKETKLKTLKLLGCQPAVRRRLEFDVEESEEFKLQLKTTLEAKVKVWAERFKSTETRDALQTELEIFITFQKRNDCVKIQGAISCPICAPKTFLIKVDKDGKPSSSNGWNKKRFISHLMVHEKKTVDLFLYCFAFRIVFSLMISVLLHLI